MIKKIDAIEGMVSLPSGSVKAIITSPPYKKKEGYSKELMMTFAREAKRVLRKSGIVIINFAQLSEDPIRHHWIPIIMEGTGFRVGSEPVWAKSMPELGGRFTPLSGDWWLNNKHEHLYIYGLDHSKIDRLAVGVPYADKSNLKSRATGKKKKDVQCRGTLIYSPYENKTKSRNHVHPYQWPDDLCEYMIRLSGVKGTDVVLDPFCGSGRLGQVLKKIHPGAEFIGFDKRNYS